MLGNIPKRKWENYGPEDKEKGFEILSFQAWHSQSNPDFSEVLVVS